MTRNPGELDFAHVRRRFDRAASTFSRADFTHRAAADGLIHRLLPMTIQPKRILDLGCAAGAGSRRLVKQFRKARVLSLDASGQMLVTARSKRRWWSRVREIQGDARQLPLASGSIDLVFANMLLPLIDQLAACLGEVARVLRNNGLFVFSTLGPGSFVELREAWGNIDDGLHVQPFVDMHNLGDAVTAAGLRDPVLDVDYMSIRYRDTKAMFADIKAAGAGNNLRDRRQSLTGKGRIERLRESLRSATDGEGLQLGIELVYGHAWGGGVPNAPGEFHLPPSAIGRRQVQ